MTRALLLAPLVVGSGCAINMDNAKAALSPRAATELGCPSSKLDFEEVKQPLAASTVLVKGCGKTQSYRLLEGQWVPAPPAPPPPAY